MFANNRSVKSAMGAAVQAAEKLLVRDRKEGGSKGKGLVMNDFLDVPSLSASRSVFRLVFHIVFHVAVSECIHIRSASVGARIITTQQPFA